MPKKPVKRRRSGWDRLAEVVGGVQAQTESQLRSKPQVAKIEFSQFKGIVAAQLYRFLAGARSSPQGLTPEQAVAIVNRNLSYVREGYEAGDTTAMVAKGLMP